MIESHRKNKTFKPVYTYARQDTDEVFEAPFAVAVWGITKPEPFLGVGRVIGSIDLHFSRVQPVIEVEDSTDGKSYTLLDCESWWVCPVPEEVITAIISKRLGTCSVKQYIAEINTKPDDEESLEDNGIDSEDI
jgi:hypothetical protein